MACIRAPVPTSFTHLCGTNLLRVAASSFPSFDINIWANAVRQLLVENPQQSLAVTTWECSSEGYALRCDYKQQKDSRANDAVTELTLLASLLFRCATDSSISLFFSLLFFCFYTTILRRQAVACTSIRSLISFAFAKYSRRVLPFTLYYCSRYLWR